MRNCRVEMDPKTRGRPEEKFKILLGKFRKRVNDIGILTTWKEKQFFESKGEKRRRKRKEAALQRKKDTNRI
jgi:ribosomal protein S21